MYPRDSMINHTLICPTDFKMARGASHEGMAKPESGRDEFVKLGLIRRMEC